MNRYEFENLISEYLDGSIPFKKRIEFEDYMKDDKDAEFLVRNIKTTISEMNNLQKVKAADNFNEIFYSEALLVILNGMDPTAYYIAFLGIGFIFYKLVIGFYFFPITVVLSFNCRFCICYFLFSIL